MELIGCLGCKVDFYWLVPTSIISGYFLTTCLIIYQSKLGTQRSLSNARHRTHRLQSRIGGSSGLSDLLDIIAITCPSMAMHVSGELSSRRLAVFNNDLITWLLRCGWLNILVCSFIYDAWWWWTHATFFYAFYLCAVAFLWGTGARQLLRLQSCLRWNFKDHNFLFIRGYGTKI